MRGRVSLTLVSLKSAWMLQQRLLLLLLPLLLRSMTLALVQALEAPPLLEEQNRDWAAGCLPLHHQTSPPHPPLHPHSHAHDSGGSAGH